MHLPQKVWRKSYPAKLKGGTTCRQYNTVKGSDQPKQAHSYQEVIKQVIAANDLSQGKGQRRIGHSTILYVCFTFSYTELACAIPKAGGAFDYAERAMGKNMAFIAGMAQNVEFIFAPPAIAFAIGAYFNLFFYAAVRRYYQKVGT